MAFEPFRDQWSFDHTCTLRKPFRDVVFVPRARIRAEHESGWKWIGTSGELADVRSLFPVLVVHDERMGYTALGKFLEREFRALLGTVPAGVIVHPLIVLTISDLENLSSSIENFGFVEFIRAYSLAHSERMSSVHNFMATSEFRHEILPSKPLIAASDELLWKVRIDLFPYIQEVRTEDAPGARP